MSHVPVLDALWLQTGQAYSLLRIPLAPVSARKRLITTILHQLYTFGLPADVLESRIIAYRRLAELLLTKPATQSLLLFLVLFTGVVYVVG